MYDNTLGHMTIAVGVSDYIDVPGPTATATPSAMATTHRRPVKSTPALVRSRVCRTPTIFMEGSSDESLVRHVASILPGILSLTRYKNHHDTRPECTFRSLCVRDGHIRFVKMKRRYLLE